VPGADHFFGGAADAEVAGIFQRVLDFLAGLEAGSPARAAT
jgi:hypothetical protein